jgi:hypothetical protein
MLLIKMDDEQCLLVKQRYPIGRKFWAKVRRIRPFGIFVEIDETPKDSDRCVESVGLIDIGHAALDKEGSGELPLDASQWPQEGTYINCMVCYYRENSNEHGKYIQLGLSWLGKTSQSQPDK